MNQCNFTYLVAYIEPPDLRPLHLTTAAAAMLSNTKTAIYYFHRYAIGRFHIVVASVSTDFNADIQGELGATLIELMLSEEAKAAIIN